MTHRASILDNFISKTPWKNAERAALAGDASMRRYTRLFDVKSDHRAILMDAPPDAGEDVRPFVKVAQYLSQNGLAAPEIFEADETNGFLILEDFGHDLFDVVCDGSPELEPDLYAAAVDCLVTLVDASPLEGALDYQPQMLELSLSCYRWYAEAILERNLDAERGNCRDALAPLIASLGAGSVTILRDFHAQNLLWLPERSAPQNVGLLDFQDAMLGHPAYDLISLTTDARRDVSPHIQDMCVERFIVQTGANADDFKRAAAICSVQRNLRILMIFARMSLYFKRPHYVDLIPRVWDHLQRSLRHPDLGDLGALLMAHLPPPTPENLARLKEKCGTVSTL